jgi:hypothetical protein
MQTTIVPGVSYLKLVAFCKAATGIIRIKLRGNQRFSFESIPAWLILAKTFVPIHC